MRQAGAHLLSSGRATVYAARQSPASLGFVQAVRHSHIGGTPLDKPAEARLEILPYPPHPVPSRPLLPTLRRAKTMLITGPKGRVVLPLHYCIRLQEEPIVEQDEAKEDTTTSANTIEASSAPAELSTAPSPDENLAPALQPRTATDYHGQPTRITLSLRNEHGHKKEKGTWGLTRNIMHNAFVGVTEGHTVLLRLVGVGYRASLELDPLPRQTKLDKALASRSYFASPEAKQNEIDLDNKMKEAAVKEGPNMRLNIRLGYSHPVILPVPYGITCQVPQPTKIILKGADRELLGNFASSIRSWRVPEPYKGKGIFINHEIVKLKTVKKK